MSSGGNNWDLDEIFAFKTPRLVRIRDRRLGIMNFIFGTAIFAYIVGYLVVWRQGYKEEAPLLGFRRLTLQQPSADLMRYDDELPYCGVNGTYKADVDNPVEAPQAPCQYLDQFGAQYPRKQSDAIFLSTRITNERYRRNASASCINMTHSDCQYEKIAEATFYVADPEFYTFFIDHSLIVPDFEWSASAWQLDGRMLDVNDNEVDPCKPYQQIGKNCPDFIKVGVPNTYDIFPLATLLEAAGVSSLDSAGGDLGKIQTETHRYAGIVLLLEVNYDNYYTYHPSNIRFTFRVHSIQNTEFKVEQPLNAPGSREDERLVYDRHGIQIVVQQSGSIGRFNFAQLLTVLVTSLGLLAVSSTLVNFTAFSLLPMRYIYRQYRQVDSVDFSDIQHLPQTQIKRFKHEDLLNPRPRVFADTSEDASSLLAGGADPLSNKISREKQRESGADNFPHLWDEALNDERSVSTNSKNFGSKSSHRRDSGAGHISIPNRHKRKGRGESKEEPLLSGATDGNRTKSTYDST
eukprot:gb/GECG01016669.1/.p1 GENE.gb/GECG01016669.1/~~gb/GECG01016669.1/.p1  ORF type:complete len:519 (+),score=48.62 gb/GECG01016669.1/:1-1557(+)